MEAHHDGDYFSLQVAQSKPTTGCRASWPFGICRSFVGAERSMESTLSGDFKLVNNQQQLVWKPAQAARHSSRRRFSNWSAGWTAVRLCVCVCVCSLSIFYPARIGRGQPSAQKHLKKVLPFASICHLSAARLFKAASVDMSRSDNCCRATRTSAQATSDRPTDRSSERASGSLAQIKAGVWPPDR